MKEYEDIVSKRGKQPSGPIFVSLTPRELMNSNALLTFSAFWIRIRGALLYRPREVSPICESDRENTRVIE